MKLKLRLQYFDHLMGRADSLEETLMLGKSEGKWRRGWQRIRWLDSITKLNGYKFDQTLGDGDREIQCATWVCRESDVTATEQ